MSNSTTERLDSPVSVDNTRNGNGTTAAKPGWDATGQSELSDLDLGIRHASTIEPERVEWDWYGRLARGKFALLGGNGGEGKSQVAARITASLSAGVPLPDGSLPARQGSVIILSGEDGPGDTIVPRLVAAGADLKRVTILTPTVTTRRPDGTSATNLVNFADLIYWREMIRRHPDLKLIVADPLPLYLGPGVNSHRDADVRQVLEPFLALLEECGIALLGIAHLGKSTDPRSPTHRILGSVAFGNLARTVHLVATDPDDDQRHFFFHTKANLTEKRPTLAYRIVPHAFTFDSQEIATSRVEFEAEPVEIDAREVMEANRAGPRRKGPPPEKTMQLAEWLFDHLAAQPGPTLLAAILDAAGAAGFVGRKVGNRWSTGSLIYEACERLAKLPAPRSGRSVSVSKEPIGGRGRHLVHWQLVAKQKERTP